MRHSQQLRISIFNIQIIFVFFRLKPFGVERFVYSGRARKSVEIENGAEFVSFEDLLVQADFVIISTAYTEDMAGMFNKKVFSIMKNTAILINISRGRNTHFKMGRLTNFQVTLFTNVPLSKLEWERYRRFFYIKNIDLLIYTSLFLLNNSWTYWDGETTM